MEKKQYNKPNAEVFAHTFEDIIVASGGVSGEDSGSQPIGPGIEMPDDEF